MKTALVVGLEMLPLLGVCYAQAPNSHTPQYAFRNGEVVRYQLDLQNEVDDYDATNDRSRQGSVQRSFIIREELQNAGFGDGYFSLAIHMENVQWDGARAQGETWDAVRSSTATLRVNNAGSSEAVSVAPLTQQYEAQHERVQRVWEEATGYLAVQLPSRALTPGTSWEINVPLKFVGGVLSGQGVNVPAKVTAEAIEVSHGEHRLRATIDFLKQPELPMENSSTANAKAVLQLEQIHGHLIFSLDRGSLVDYQGSIKTTFRLEIDGKLVDQHKMAFSFQLTRL